MSPPSYPHLFLPGPANTRDDYSNPRRGGGTNISPRERVAHADYVRRSLEAAWARTEETRAASHSTRSGAYLEFSSEPGFDLAIKSLEPKRTGIRLLNVRTEGTEDKRVTRATVFVPHEKSAYFLNKIREYAEEDNRPRKDGTTTPRNSTLVDSIGGIRAALLDSSFWQDTPDNIPGDEPDWVEVWLSGEDLGEIEAFEGICRERGIEIGEGRLSFPDRTVLLIQASRSNLEMLIEHSSQIAEFRAARQVSTFYVEMENRQQVELVDRLLERTEIRDVDQVAVLVLDHGVNNGHRLLEPVLPDVDCHSVEPVWGSHDDHGHGTLMAGTVAYGDLLDCLQNGQPLVIGHGVESTKILPPPPEVNPKRLWAYYTAQGVSRAEIQAPHRRRIICMAVSSDGSPTRGRPTSWSGQVDELASGYNDDKRRSIILSSGNIHDPDSWREFPASNLTTEVEDPGQAWNALTVGAYTEKVKITDPALKGYAPIAGGGDLSPYSSTSFTWPSRRWPIKPEVLFEGGNVARGPNDSIFDTEDLKLISTHRDPQEAQFAPFNATSAACAQASWFAARIQSLYPDAWPETIRALMVHSAEWTDAQRGSFLRDESKTSYYQLTKVCGYGVPNLEKAVSCAANSLSLISQTTIQPFDKVKSRYITKDMHLYRLPWPVSVLEDLGELLVKMRVTLSYFVEPSPGEVGWKDRYRYASHALRFELNGHGEGEDEFVSRINKRAREDDEHPGTEGAADHWAIGEARNVGSIHSDIWTGTATELALSNMIAVHPAAGWWRDRSHLGKYDKETRYSLVVSFELPEQEIDIYTPVAVQLGVEVPVEIRV